MRHRITARKLGRRSIAGTDREHDAREIRIRNCRHQLNGLRRAIGVATPERTRRVTSDDGVVATVRFHDGKNVRVAIHRPLASASSASTMLERRRLGICGPEDFGVRRAAYHAN